MADSKTTATKTLAGGTLTTTPVEKVNAYRTNSESANNYGFAAIKSDGSVVAWGQNATVPASLDGTVDATQIYSNNSNFVALRTDGGLIPLGNQSIDAATLKKLDGTVDVKTVASTNGAFAALLADGSVVAWGEKTQGGDSKLYTNNGGSKFIAKDLDGTIDVTKIYSNEGAFAAIRADGSVVTWGGSNSGADSTAVAKQLDGTIDATQIFSKGDAFAALRTDGSVVTWGSSNGYGADSSSVAKQLDGTIDVTQIYSNKIGFAALRTDGSVIGWGDGYYSSANVTNVKQIYSNGYVFTALKTDGSVVTWGYSWSGADISSVAKQLDGTIDVTAIYSNNASHYGAFAAVRTDGSVVTWGDKSNGGDSSGVAKELDGTIDVTQVYSINNEWHGAFAALRVDGSVVTWGNYDYGGDSTDVAEQLNGTIDVKQIVSNSGAFAAIRVDGSVVTWGNGSYGSDSSKVASQLDGTIDVVSISSNNYAFSALRADGSVVTWGDYWYGGNSSSVTTKLTSGVETFANIATDDFYTAPSSTAPAPVVVKNSAPTGTLTIEGTAKENETLTVTNKIADVDGLGKMSYQWLADGGAIIGAVQPSYVLSQMDVGKKISVVVNYTDGLGFTENTTSSAVKVANVNDTPTGKVSISGTTAKGQMLIASNTLEDADGLGEISYQWMRDSKEISGQTKASYTLVPSDMFKKISVKANYTDLQNTKESVTSAETSKVTAAINHAPTGTVLIHGELLQNQTLSVSNNLADVDGLGTIGYQWVINNAPVEGATQTTYTLTQADVYKTVSVIASYTDKLGKLESVSGGVVLNENDKPTGNATINGIAQVGETLTVKNDIVDIDGLSGDFQYEWRADGEAFAEGDALTLTKEQIGKAISVAVEYTDNGGTFESIASVGATEKVIPLNTLPTGYIIIMGEAKNGTELSVLSTLADVDGLGEFNYQWLSNDTPIKNETTPTYKLGLGDVGERISVNVHYVDGYNTLESVTSADTAAIQSSYVNGIIQEGSKDSKIVGTDKNDVLSALPNINYSITAQAGNDVVSGNTGNDTLDGGKGDDKILGGKGNDKLIGSDGNDTLKGGLGADTMQGGDGNDYYFIDDAKDVVIESNKNGRLGGSDTIETTLSYTLDKNLENVVLAGEKKTDATGNDFANQISGNSAENVLKGEAGNDDIFGDKGADTLFGGDSEDVLDGGEGDDVINGDAGDDFLKGGEGYDTLNGGAGEDVAIFNSAQTDYQITPSTMAAGSVQLVIKYIGSEINEGTDILNGIEMLKFGDDEVVNVIDIVGVLTTPISV